MFKLTPVPRYLLVVLTIVNGFLFQSCKTTYRSFGYFETLKKDTSISRFVSPQLESKIAPGDNLGILFKSLNVEENARYNTGVLLNTIGATMPAYLVQPDGTIKISRLGSIKVAGLTRRELADTLERQMLPYLKDPIAEISFLNHKITILGSVAKPQVISMSEEQISLLDAIVLSGDVTTNARKDDVMIIRNKDDKKVIKHVNLSNHSIFNSPWNQLEPDDIVFVPSDLSKEVSEEKRRRLQTTLSLVASGLSLVIILIDRLTR